MHGLSIASAPKSTLNEKHYHTHKVYVFTNYILLGAATSCIFLTLSVRLFPSLSGFFFILLQLLTILGAVSGCATSLSSRWYAARMVSTVLIAIFQGSVALLIFSRTSEFLHDFLKSYVRDEDGAVILKLAGGICALMFCLEWIVLTLAFFLKYYAYVERDGGVEGTNMGTSKVMHKDEDDVRNWPWPLQV